MGDVPRTPCPKAESGPLPPRCHRAAGGGSVNSGTPVADPSQGPESSGPALPTRKQRPGPALFIRLWPASPRQRPEAVGAGATATTSSGLCLVGPGAGKWISRRRIRVQMFVSWVCLSWLLQMEALFTCQRRLVSLPLGISVAGSRLSEPPAPGTNGPPLPFPRRGRTSLRSLSPRSAPRGAPAHRVRARSRSGERSPGVVSKRVPRPSEPFPVRWPTKPCL